jgi:hypothetical protein
VLDLSGRSVATLLDAVAGSERVGLEWSGRDRDGRSLPPGLYLVKAQVGNDEAVRRIIRLE